VQKLRGSIKKYLEILGYVLNLEFLQSYKKYKLSY
jgi:hypothetical protein